MEYPRVDDLTRPEEAFGDDSPQGALSQALFQLLLGFLLQKFHYEHYANLLEDDDERPGLAAMPGLEPMPMDALNAGGFLELVRELNERYDGLLIGLRFGLQPDDANWAVEGAPETVQRVNVIMQEMTFELFEKRDPLTAAKLIVLGSHHPNQLVAVCSNITALNILRIPHWRLIVGRLWEFMLRSPYDNVRELAGRVLGMLTHGGSQPAPGVAPPSGAAAPPPATGPDSLLFHGTRWPKAPGNPPSTVEWWMPGQAFPDYLEVDQNVDLYKGAQHFEWEGGYSDGARAIAARNLYDWIQHHLRHPVRLMAHSHGGNVAMAASHLTSGFTVPGGTPLDVAQLVLLSTPIHWHQYYPAPGRVGEVVHVRVPLDAAIIAEQAAVRASGGSLPSQKIPASVIASANPPIHVHVLKGHVGNHRACYDESAWKSKGIVL